MIFLFSFPELSRVCVTESVRETARDERGEKRRRERRPHLRSRRGQRDPAAWEGCLEGARRIAARRFLPLAVMR